VDQNSGIGQSCLSIDSYEREAYFQMLAEFREEEKVLPDYSPHYRKMVHIINTILATKKIFK
jgi:hypothetical protein